MTTNQPIDDAVAVDDLHVDYGTQQGLSGVTFTAPEGSFVAVLGPNGSGKTSLIKALAGIVSPSRGSIRVLRRDPRKAGSGLVGYVPQVKTLERRFPATSVELVVSGMRGRWPFRVSASERSAALDALGHAGGVHLAERQLSTLSGGELQRIYLARSLIRHPHLVLLDEPATGIDAAGALDLYDVLETYQAQRRATIIMVTHDWNVAFHHATHVLLLNRRQIAYGTAEHVLTEENLRRAFGHVGHEHAMFRMGHGHG